MYENYKPLFKAVYCLLYSRSFYQTQVRQLRILCPSGEPQGPKLMTLEEVVSTSLSGQVTEVQNIWIENTDRKTDNVAFNAFAKSLVPKSTGM